MNWEIISNFIFLTFLGKEKKFHLLFKNMTQKIETILYILI